MQTKKTEVDEALIFLCGLLVGIAFALIVNLL